MVDEEQLAKWGDQLRRYFLGMLSSAETEEIENIVLSNDLNLTLSVVQDELIEDYVTGELSASECSAFESRLAVSKELRDKVRFSALLLGSQGIEEKLALSLPLGKQHGSDSAFTDAPDTSKRRGSDPFDEAYVKRLHRGDVRTQAHFVAYVDELIELNLNMDQRVSAEVEDVRQETFVRVLAALRKGRVEQPLKIRDFLNSICKNVLAERIQARALKRVQTEAKEDYRSREMVLKAMLKLSPPDRRLLREIYIEGRDARAVCRKAGVSEGYLRVLLHRLQKFLDILKADNDVGPHE